jgi:hypothetical protein
MDGDSKLTSEHGLSAAVLGEMAPIRIIGTPWQQVRVWCAREGTDVTDAARSVAASPAAFRGDASLMLTEMVIDRDQLERAQHIWGPPSVPAPASLRARDVLRRDLAFAQLPPLTPNDLITEAAKRSITVDLLLLEELHQLRVLIPFLEFRTDTGTSHDVFVVPDDVNVHHGLPAALVIAGREGRLHDPAAQRFRRWRRREAGDLLPASQAFDSPRCLLYSPHQLLTLELLRNAIGRCVTVARDREFALALSPDEEIRPEALNAFAMWRQLAIALHAVDSRYWFVVSGRFPTFPLDRSQEYFGAFDPNETLAWLGMSVQEIRQAANLLRRLGAAEDDLGDFYDIVRRANLDRWETLSGSALIAMDFRRASEVLDVFADDLTDAPDPPELPMIAGHPPNLKDQRLRQRERSLDGALLELGLLPRPSLLIAVEGQTEEHLLPRVLDLLWSKYWREFIAIECYHGVSRDLTLLAKFVTRPMLGRDYTQFVQLEQPVTRLLVLADAEAAGAKRDYRTYASREEQRKRLLKAMLDEVPVQFHRDLASARAKLITIRTWNSWPFEFAHFTNAELADAMTTVAAGRPSTGGRRALLAAIQSERTRPRGVIGQPSPNVDAAWKRWFGGRAPFGLSKPRLADELWPVLEQRIGASSAGHEPLIWRRARLALHLARELPRGSMGLTPSRRRN